MNARKLLALLPLLALITVLPFLNGCSDDSVTGPNGRGNLRLYLVDAIGDFDAVNIVVEQVMVQEAGYSEKAGWVVVSDLPDTYDLLQLTNGAQAVLGNESLRATSYSQIRLFIGAGSNVVVDGTTHPLTIPSGMQSGLKLNHAFEIEKGERYDLTLDFNAGQSIHQTGNGEYILNPVIRVVPVEASGYIEGNINPTDAAATVVTSTTNGDEVNTWSRDTDGYFMLNALPGGTYDVTVTAEGYQNLTISDVVVEPQTPTDLGVIELLPE